MADRPLRMLRDLRVARGAGSLRVAQRLNGDGIPCPGRRGTAWAGSTELSQVAAHAPYLSIQSRTRVELPYPKFPRRSS